MLQTLSKEIEECYRHAEDCRRKANEAKIQTVRQELLDMQRRWLFLARSYQLSAWLSEFSDDTNKPCSAKTAAGDERNVRRPHLI